VRALALLVAFAATAEAKGWPLPAAGPTMSGDPELIFSFDDGPNPKTTPEVLDALAKHHIKAIFFMVGEMAGSTNKAVAPLLARMIADGHVIATHTMHHKDLCRTKDRDKAAREIDEGRDTIEKASGQRTYWFRTPYGVRCAQVEELLAERNLSHFHWDLDPQEWKHNDPVKAVNYVEKQVGKMTGRNVLLMHDIKKATVTALPQILDWIDEENARRKESHKRQIRIIQAPELAIEEMQEGLFGFLEDLVPTGLSARLASVM
jgi:peptidoglycan/xylan/chitin deacetylase (PgdA/CDA1 family)